MNKYLFYFICLATFWACQNQPSTDNQSDDSQDNHTSEISDTLRFEGEVHLKKLASTHLRGRQRRSLLEFRQSKFGFSGSE